MEQVPNAVRLLRAELEAWIDGLIAVLDALDDEDGFENDDAAEDCGNE